MLSELGIKFTSLSGESCSDGITDLSKIENINLDNKNQKLSKAKFTVISDVNSSLFGKNGATYIYSKQKGLKEDDFSIVDAYVENFSEKVLAVIGKDYSSYPGSGAAGGLGYAFLSFLDSTIQSGSSFMINYLDLEKKIQGIDIVITGEGKLDKQSYMGKAPIEIARIAKKFNKKVIFLAGSILDEELRELSSEDKELVDASFSIQRRFLSLEKAMNKSVTKDNIEQTIKQILSILEFKNNILMGIFCIVVAGFCFSLMSLFIKLAGDLPSMQKGFFRNIIAVGISSIPLIKHWKVINLPKDKIEWSVLISRSVFGTIGLVFNFYAITHISLADSTIIQKLSPFVILILSFIFFKEKMTVFQLISIIIAFIGVGFIVRPTGDGFISMGALAALLGAFCSGIAYTCVRYLGTHNVSGEFIIFFFSTLSTFMLLPYLIFDYRDMTVFQFSMLLLAGASATVGQYGVTFAYKYAAAKNISVFDYSQVLFSGILGFIFFNELPDLQSLIGYIIVISVGIILVKKSK